MKISLINVAWTQQYDAKLRHFAKKVGGSYPPIGLASLAAVAEKQGHEVQIIDGEIEDLSTKQMIEKINHFSPDIVGITAMTPFYSASVSLAKQLKQQDKLLPIVIGGTHITILREEAFIDCFDYAFIGEAEKSWELFLNKYEKGHDVSQVGGLIYRNKNKKIIYTGAAEPVGNINDLPMPSRHLLNNDNYITTTPYGEKKFTTIMTMRGCPFKCIFCAAATLGKDHRQRNPENVIHEIRTCKEKYNLKHFHFIDETFTINRKHTIEICDRLIRDNMNITWGCETRANLFDEELVEKMVESGLVKVAFGLESVDENVRRIMKKKVPLKSYIDANRIANKYEIETMNSCIIGLPGETKDTIRKTLRFLREAKDINLANVAIAVPYPGTELYEMAKNGEYGLKLVTEDFSEFKRYNSAVMQVGDLSPQDLIDIQNEAFASIFIFAPWRWEAMIKKQGIVGAELTLKRLEKCIDEGKETNFLTDKQLGINRKE